MVYAGIDVGSLSTETVLVDDRGAMIGYNIRNTGANAKKAAAASFDALLEELGVPRESVAGTVATGYGRISVPFADKQITEITCHAAGMITLLPDARTIIDIGGQDSKSIRINAEGKVQDFVMNDKCAAGTGRFLEVMARTLEVDLAAMGEISLRSQSEVKVSSMCTVFAESEVVSLIAEGHPTQDILKGVHRAIADRTVALVERIGVAPVVTMSGGVAKNVGVRACIEQRLGVTLALVPEPQIVGALGAAVLAWRAARA
jgi:predicted CoA-substrate-specific enzyme activase